MGAENKDPKPQDPRPTEASKSLAGAEAGVLKKQEKERLERDIASALEGLRGSLSREQVAALIEKLANAQARRGLESLKNDLENERTLAGENVSDESRAAILKLIADVQKATQLDISELRLEVRRVNPSPHWEPLPSIYPTNAIPAVRKLGESRLSRNIILDVAGVVAGTLDSAAATVKLLLTMIADFFLLPRDLLRALRSRNGKNDENVVK